MARSFSAQDLNDLVGGQLVGDGSVQLTGVASLGLAGPSDLSLLASGKYLESFHGSKAGAVLVADDLSSVAGGPGTRVIVRDPAGALATALRHMFPVDRPTPGVDPTARVGTGTRLGRDVSIAAYVVIGCNAKVGDRVAIGPGVVIEDGVEIGDDVSLGPRAVCGTGTRIGHRVTIKAGAVLGGIGFGYTSSQEGHRRVPHVGRCIIEDDVDIGSNTTIDRGSIDDTVVGQGTKIDNLVQLGHNVRVGRHCLVMSQVGVAGSSRIGDGVILAGQVGVAGHLTIGDRARIAAQSGISSDVPAGAEYGGYPARANREWLRSLAVLYRIAPIAKDLESLVRERRTHA